MTLSAGIRLGRYEILAAIDITKSSSAGASAA